MKILVPIKRVVDYSIRIRVKADGTGVETAGVKMSINPFDEIAIEEALRLKENGLASEVVLVSIGSEKTDETLRAGLALGADRAIWVQHHERIEPLAIAKLLKAIISSEAPQLVLMGKQAIDDDCNQTGQMLSALLGWPQGTFASKIELKGAQVNVTREVDGGHETLALTMPAIITTDLRLNTPRFASLPNIMKAKSKPMAILNSADLGVDTAPRLHIFSVKAPTARSAGVIVPDVAALVRALKSQAKVLP